MSESIFHDRLLAARTQYARALRDPLAAQAEILRECVMPNVETVFGREHGFASIRDANDYRRAVPIRSYDDISPYIERAADGEPGVLTVERPMMFARTSGTTGSAKKIPHTGRDAGRRLVQRMAEDGDFVERYPEALQRRDSVFSLTLDWRPPTEFTKGGTPYVGISTWGAPPDAQLPPWFHAPWFRLPPEPSSYADRLYLRLRYALEADIRFFAALNPSTLLVVARQLDAFMPRLIEELHAGTVAGRRLLAPNPVRARELEAIAARGTVLPSEVWPKISGISCWRGGSTSLYIPAVQSAFGADVEITPYGIIASEGFVTMTAFRSDAKTAGLLAVGTHFYEFLPVEDAGRPDARTLLAGELEVGGKYLLVITQQSGLYRYSIGDVLRATAIVDGVPRLEFIGRHGNASSFTGEKLTEEQIVAAVRAAERATGFDVANFACCPTWAEPPYYAFVVESVRGLDARQVVLLADAIDEQLGVHNDEYPAKRASGRLAPARVHVVRGGTFVRYWNQRFQGAAVPTQLKQNVLHKDDAPVSELVALSSSAEA